jgi:alpha-methylacyl-CoA racemase
MSSSGPLAGVRVLDLTRLFPGPFATQILRDMGAEVIKIEDSNGGDYMRMSPPLCEDETSATFHAINRGKKSMLLNLKKPNDRAVFLELCQTADVLVEGFRPGVMAKLGLSPELLRQKFPSLVICSISGYGQTGPDALRAGHDLNYLARAGVLGQMKKPAVLPVQVADIAAGAYPAVVQILAGLRRREKFNQGSLIDVSMADCSFALMALPVARRAVDGVSMAFETDVLVGSIPCYDVYETKDGGHITVGALEPKFWEPLVESLGLSELNAFATGAEGVRVKQQLQKVFSSRTAREWREWLKDRDLMVEVVNASDEVWKRDPQLASRPLTLKLKVSQDGPEYEFARTPLNMSDLEPVAQRGPRLGEHTAQLLRELEQRRQEHSNNGGASVSPPARIGSRL